MPKQKWWNYQKLPPLIHKDVLLQIYHFSFDFRNLPILNTPATAAIAPIIVASAEL